MAIYLPTEYNYFTLGASTASTAVTFTKPAAQGDFILRIIATVSAVATGTAAIVTIRDGGTGTGGYTLLTQAAPIGVYTFEIGCSSISANGWAVTTGANVSVWISGKSGTP